MKPKLLWNRNWVGTEAKIIAFNETWVWNGTKGTGIIAAVEFPLPEGNIDTFPNDSLHYSFEYSPAYVPRVLHFIPIKPSEGDFIQVDAPKETKSSMIALLNLACDWTEFEGRIQLDPKIDDGIVCSLKFGARHDGTSIRRRWLIAWLWPLWNKKKRTTADRAWELNRFLKALDWDEPITAGTLKTTANRMELFF